MSLGLLLGHLCSLGELWKTAFVSAVLFLKVYSMKTLVFQHG